MGLRAGDLAPDFDAQADDGRRVRLRDLRGAWVVLSFFARASMPGSSLEARAFQAALPEFERLGTWVIGVSSDTEAHTALLRERCGLSFALLPDAGRRICRSYDVLGGLGGLLGLAARQTFLISPEGIIVQHWARVNPANHAGEVLRELQRRAASQSRSGAASDSPSPT